MVSQIIPFFICAFRPKHRARDGPMRWILHIEIEDFCDAHKPRATLLPDVQFRSQTLILGEICNLRSATSFLSLLRSGSASITNRTQFKSPAPAIDNCKKRPQQL